MNLILYLDRYKILTTFTNQKKYFDLFDSLSNEYHFNKNNYKIFINDNFKEISDLILDINIDNKIFICNKNFMIDIFITPIYKKLGHFFVFL